MRPKSCKRCGRPFEPASKYTYLCPECHAQAKASGVISKHTCRQCGVSFQGGPRAWYCPNCRQERRRARERGYQRNGSLRKLGSTDLCIRCGKEYIVVSGRQKYCPFCAGEAINETVRQHKRQYAAERSEQMAQYKKDMARNRHVCVVCGTVFDADVPTVTCSPACDAVRRREAQHKADVKRSPRRKQK